jgi:hypothetical protein
MNGVAPQLIECYEDSKQLLDAVNEAYSIFFGLYILTLVCHLSSISDSSLETSLKISLYMNLTFTIIVFYLIASSTAKVVIFRSILFIVNNSVFCTLNLI